jgi:hypothetical protein
MIATARCGKLERVAPLLGQALDLEQPQGVRANARNMVAAKARELLDAGRPEAQPRRRCFHWSIEFPEVFEREDPGFDGVIGNPPFQGRTVATAEFGVDYMALHRNTFAPYHGKADLVGLFL